MDSFKTDYTAIILIDLDRHASRGLVRHRNFQKLMPKVGLALLLPANKRNYLNNLW
jgi:hypothetical protein